MIALILGWPAIKWALDNWRLVLILLAIVAVLAFGGYERVKGYSAGNTAAITKITKANQEEARRAQAAAKNVDDCYAAGGSWDRARGLCDDAAGQ